jgi:adenosylcobinamide-GDP ribazoletransferase
MTDDMPTAQANADQTPGKRGVGSDFWTAVSLLTVVPVPISARSHEPRPNAAGWFPLVGLALGALGWGLVHLLGFFGWSGSRGSLVVAAVVVTLWALVTRLLHWDGLADVADAWWGGATPQRRLEIMKDPRSGAFGVTAIVMVALLQVTAVGQILLNHQLPLLIVPALARIGATFAAWLGTSARPDGLGRTVVGRPSLAGVLPAAAGVLLIALAASAGMHSAGAAYVAIALLLALGVPHVVSKRMGGVTGDVMGATVLIIETLLFLGAATGLEFFR